MSGEDQNADLLEAADSSKSRILQKQLEFEQLLMNNQLWAEQQAVKLEVGIKTVALQAAVEATEVRKCLPGRRNDSVVEVVNDLSSRRPYTGVQKQHPPLSLDRASSEKDIRAEKDYPHRGRETRVSYHRRHDSHRSSRGRSRSRSRDRGRRHRSRSRSETRDGHSRSRRDIGHSHRHRQRHPSRSRSRSRSRSTRGIQSGRDKSRSKNKGYSSRSPPKKIPQK